MSSVCALICSESNVCNNSASVPLFCNISCPCRSSLLACSGLFQTLRSAVEGRTYLICLLKLHQRVEWWGESSAQRGNSNPQKKKKNMKNKKKNKKKKNKNKNAAAIIITIIHHHYKNLQRYSHRWLSCYGGLYMIVGSAVGMEDGGVGWGVLG